MIDPSQVLERLVDGAVAIDDVRRADAERVEVPGVDRRRGASRLPFYRRVARAAFGAVPDHELLFRCELVPLPALQRIALDVHDFLQVVGRAGARPTGFDCVSAWRVVSLG